MLPFMNKKKIADGVILGRGKTSLEVKPEVHSPTDETDPKFESICEDILRAVQDKSVIDLALNLKEAFQHLSGEDTL